MSYLRKSLFVILLLLIIFPLSVKNSFAKDSLPSITVINLIRGYDLGHEKDNLYSSLKSQWNVTNSDHINAAWLWQYSALEDTNMTSFAKQSMKNQEFGLLLEISRNSAAKAGVAYKGQGPSYFSDGMLLVSYDLTERRKLIDASFAKFKEVFGYYPKTVGAWWIGADSIDYMQKKYRITAALKASDQYLLDVYTIWGSPWSIPYVSASQNAGMPAALPSDTSNVVILQWAARDPTRGYFDNAYSIQDYYLKQFDSGYIDYLFSVYLQKPLDSIVIGLENGGDDKIFQGYYKTWLDKAVKAKNNHKANIVLAKDYAQSLLKSKKSLSRNSFLTKDYKSSDQSFWFNTENYRAFIKKGNDNIYLLDLRDYSKDKNEDFDLLPNSQALLWESQPFIVDSVVFPTQKILLTKSNDILNIKNSQNETILYSGSKKIAVFSKDKLSIFPNGLQKDYSFTREKAGINSYGKLLILALLYLIFIYIYKKHDPKVLKLALLILVPLVISYPLLSKLGTSDMLFIFDKKELLLFSIFPFKYFPTVSFGLTVVKILPIIALLISHFVLIVSSRKKKYTYLYLLLVLVISLIYLNIPYFPLNKSVYIPLLLIIIFICMFVFIGSFYLLRKNKFKQPLVISALVLIPVTAALVLVLLFSRSEFAITPFELNALEYIKSQNKQVIYVSQTDYNVKPIYKAVRPLLYDNVQFGSKITGAQWKIVLRPQNHILNIPDLKNELIVVPRYLGSDISETEIKNLKLVKVFDNLQFAIYRKI